MPQVPSLTFQNELEINVYISYPPFRGKAWSVHCKHMLHSLWEPLVRRGPVVIIYALLHHEIQIQITNTHILLPAFDSQALYTFRSMYTEVIYVHLIVQCVTNIDFHIHSPHLCTVHWYSTTNWYNQENRYSTLAMGYL